MGKKRLTLEFVKNEFEKEGYRLVSNSYINCYQKLEYVCSLGHKHRISWTNWQRGHRCPYCAGQGKPNIKYIKKQFEKFGYTLLSDSYVNDSSKLKYKCPSGHIHSMRWGNFRNGKRCPSCAKIMNSLTKKGSNHYNWKGGITRLNKQIRGFIISIGWSKEVFKRDNYICRICGKRGGYLVAHHIVPLSYLKYTYKINSLEDAEKCDVLRDTRNGITVCTECHEDLHKKFYFRRNLVLCLKNELMELLNGLDKPFIREILCRNPSNCWEVPLPIVGNNKEND